MQFLWTSITILSGDNMFKCLFGLILSMPQGSLCVAGPHVVAPKAPPVLLWFVIGWYPNSRLPWTNSRPTHNYNWRGFRRHYMGTSNTQEPLCDVMLVHAAHNTAAGRAQYYTKFSRSLRCMLLAPLARLAGLHVSCF